mmetsp:Transcript_66011/g.157836  ORF Transcript_66011/g.157836 Transcript_66011/m.157836 type:complete len:380 (-) Transcript_66011:71-1210(-)
MALPRLLTTVAGLAVAVASGTTLEDLHSRYDIADSALNATTCCPSLRILTRLAIQSPAEAVDEIRRSPLYIERQPVSLPSAAPPETPNSLPVVLLHGIADYCGNPWVVSLVAGARQKLGVYVTCVATSEDDLLDFLDTFLMSLDRATSIVAQKIMADPQLQRGFNLIGISQGTLLSRAYIQRFNDPPVHTFLSIHGIVTGISGVPKCFHQGQPLGLACRALAEVLGDVAYAPEVQACYFPANDLRDPLRTQSEAYLRHSQLADLNNERFARESYVKNFAKVKQFVMIKALGDSVVYPNEASWWGEFSDGSYTDLKSMRDTKLYQQDLFGLRSADAAGKIQFNVTNGDHVEFSDAEYYGWLERYMVGTSSAASNNAEMIV